MATIDFSGLVTSLSHQHAKKKNIGEDECTMSTLSENNKTTRQTVSAFQDEEGREAITGGRRHRHASISPPRSILSSSSSKARTKRSDVPALSKRERRRRAASFSPTRTTTTTARSSSSASSSHHQKAAKSKSSGYIEPVAWHDREGLLSSQTTEEAGYCPKGMSPADIFYAQLNGEQLGDDDDCADTLEGDDDVSPEEPEENMCRISPRGSIIIQDMSVLEQHHKDLDDDDEDDIDDDDDDKDEDDEDEDDHTEEHVEFEIDCFPTPDVEDGGDDNDSFADLEFPDNSSWAADTAHESRKTSSKKGKKRKKKKKTSSSCSSSTGSITSFESNLTCSTDGSILDEDGTDAITIQDIEDSILQHLPKDIQGKIPEHVWKKIFRRSLVLETKAVEEMMKEEDAPAPQKQSRRRSIMKNVGEAVSNEFTTPGERKQEEETGQVPAPDVVKEVRFNYVQVRYYERILDNNPAVSSGAAVAIGWRYKRGRRLTVEDWELQNPYEDRISLTPSVLSRQERERILKEWGYKQKDIATATRSILKAKNERKVTVQNLGGQRMEEAVENTARCVKGLLLGRFRNVKKVE
eukprot:CAMPEP_0117045928 /NCGR_PEP_ID=MMETSP0472-20121206/31770_1 /TAXON_ID=693140 ORGANISM="Tiarina fusus, Strain LIS" /NCGR_SAMPLE_ID=MMETSP0472 /ASSEMBLY_ACC=CAM_ASM_000603 /LENGTH=579 /DNA_ID=CAMNT_0004758111 /DNA_START=81 /DNA_END=1820 /DNA_ORIENTATION=-